MANRYWVGGAGTWDATTTTNWSTSSGGSGGASAPTSADDVFFDSASNATLYTVTVGTNANCGSMTVAAPLTGAVTFSLGATAVINCYGSFTLPATNCTWTGTTGAALNFLATITGNTVTSNGVSLTNMSLTFNGVGGDWTLGSALTVGQTITFTAGSFSTNNFNITCGIINLGNNLTRSISLGSSTVTLGGANALAITAVTNLTFNAGTSTINCSATSPAFAGGGLTFYNVGFTSTAIASASITGANTFNNLSITARSATGVATLTFPSATTQTINGTLTLGSGTTGVIRSFLRGSTLGSAATISAAAVSAALTDIDFRDITIAGAVAPISGTRLGDCLGNTGVTFAAGTTKYWVSAASGSWSGAVWGTSSGTTGGATTNFPLGQDTVVIDDAGLTAGNTITLNLSFNVPTISFSTRTTAVTFATGTTAATFYGDLTLSSAVTVTGTGTLTFSGQGLTQNITSAGVSIAPSIALTTVNGTLRLVDSLTTSSAATTTLTSGTINLDSNTLSTGIFNANNSNTRSVAFGTGNITLTGNGATILNCTTATGFTYTGTPTINCTYSGSTGTRTVIFGTGGTETNAPSINVSAGSDIFLLSGTGFYKNVNFTGFTGSLGVSSLVRTIYGNLTFSSGMTIAASSGAFTFGATSGTQQVTTNGKTLDFPVTQNGVGGTVQLQDDLTMGSTQTYTLTAGILDLTGNAGNWALSTGIFSSSNSNTRSIAFGTGNITLTGSNATVFTTNNLTGLSLSGTPNVFLAYAGSTGTRSVFGGTQTEALCFNYFVTAGSDTISIGFAKSIDFTGFSGTWSNATRTIFSNLTISSGMTVGAGTGITTFAATSGIQKITTNGKTLDFPVTQNGIGGTVQFQDALTMGSTRTYTFSNGTLQLKAGVTSTVGTFATSGTTQKYLQSTLQGSQATLSQASGTVNATYLGIRDINATGGATWNALTTNNNFDYGNNTGWDFGPTPSYDSTSSYRLRSFTQRGRF